MSGGLERLGVAEVCRDADQQVAEQLHDLVGVLVEEVVVLAGAVEVVQADAPRDAPRERTGLVGAQAVARARAQQRHDRVQLVGVRDGGRGCGGGLAGLADVRDAAGT